MRSTAPRSENAAAHRGPAPSHDDRAPHRRRTRRRCLLGAAAALALLGAALFLVNDPRSDASSGAAPTDDRHLTLTPTPTPAPTSRPPAPSASPPGTPVPESGPGSFTSARASGAKVGSGPRPLRYRVEVEDGIDVSPSDAAHEIADILGAPRGWTRDGTSSFQLVSAGPHDLVVRIATPTTADTLCWQGIHQDTQGEYDCEVPDGVVVNLRRWIEGSPTFEGPLHDYRALIINHEMGHYLGHQHQACPGKGRPAPVMMQQIKGLHGCTANAWPYDTEGHLISGPPAR
ncbi:DUF3152 domain-containing protein [Streptomyces sp. NPDC050560]|uniref:DUF3152 domain-containing protein n=1 Tax=Streptomyces sp. NPDC050560 TaxID=3365630 RepID=UPI00378FC50E